jgi:hypothetical protein
VTAFEGAGDPVVRAPELEDASLGGKHATASVVLALAALVVAYFVFINHYAVNSIYYDQWWDVQLLGHWYSHTLTISDLWAQHGENRIFFPNLMVLLLARTVQFNTVVEVYVSAVLLTISMAIVIVAHKRRSPSVNPLWYLPLGALMLSLVQFQDTLWGFQLAWYMVYFALALSLFVLDRPRLTWLALGIAIIAAIIGSYSSLQGLLIWPVGLLLMYQRRRPLRMSFAWLGCAVVVVVVYLFKLSLQAGASSYVFAHPLAGARFYFLAIGEVLGLGVPPSPDAGTYAIMFFGIVIFLASCWVVAMGLHRDERTGAPLGVAITVFGLLFAALVTSQRASEGLAVAGSSHYTAFDLLILVGCALTLMSLWTTNQTQTGRRKSRRSRPVLLGTTVVIVAAIGLQVVVGNTNGLEQSRWWSMTLRNAANVTVNGNQRTRPYQLETLFSGCGCFAFEAKLPKLIQVAKVHHLSMFGTGDAAIYAKEGLPLDSGSPTTRIDLPAPRATLKGGVWLGAAASDREEVVSLEFVVSGKGFKNVRVSGASRSIAGWIGAWNTVSIPNGMYELRSIAYNIGGKSSLSPAVPVDVQNP